MARPSLNRPSRSSTKTTLKPFEDYFRVRDFEYVQPLYDLAFLLEVAALAESADVPKYRTFSLWRAGYSLDGYGTSIDRWLDGSVHDADLDYIPSARIQQYLSEIRRSGTIQELRSYKNERFIRCLRLRAVRGLGISKIALAVSHTSLEEWFDGARIDQTFDRVRIAELYKSGNTGPWQTAHVVPPLLRFLHAVQEASGNIAAWDLSGINDPFEPVRSPLIASAKGSVASIEVAIEKALKRERHFRRISNLGGNAVRVRHQMGWSFEVLKGRKAGPGRSIQEIVDCLDPLASPSASGLLADLHLHTIWSDGSASVDAMAAAVVASGLKYFAVTDHSRSSKLQGGLTPPLWLRQANALTLAEPVCPVLHGVEVDILKDGSLDLPQSLLQAADLVVASVHSNWTDDVRLNTNRLLRAIESGCIDVLGHPTSALIGKPGVPDYVRPPVELNWDEVFEKCSEWKVAVEVNCFPSRLDLSLDLAKKAIEAGCSISIGSDAHARSHLLNLRFGDAALRRLGPGTVLNRFSYEEIRAWLSESRAKRKELARTTSLFAQEQFQFEPEAYPRVSSIEARVQPPRSIPDGSRVVGIDLTAGDKATGMAVLDNCVVETCSLITDNQILAFIKEKAPGIVSIDSPLGLPGGGASINPDAGIVRAAEYDLASVGIPAYPALIDSMQNLTLRGIRLRKAIEQLPHPPRVIESYPGAAQDILCIPRKQKGLGRLRDGLRRMGLKGEGLETRSHDEMDAVTSAVVGRYFESGLFEPMGIPSEAQLIVPKVHPLVFDVSPVICLAGKTGAGKSVIARYLSVFYGFEWIRTRDLIRQLLIDDASVAQDERLSNRRVDPMNISESDLREFGAVILDMYKQVPLRRRLTTTVERCNRPIVVDSVRDISDVDVSINANRPVMTWFVDCNETIIQSRLTSRMKSGGKPLGTGSPVDHTAGLIRHQADDIIPNNGSLEELRWRVDDTIFARLKLYH